MNLAVERNLPIFKKYQVIPFKGKYYINAKVGFENYLGFMNTIPRKDYFAFIDIYNGKGGNFKLGRLDSMLVNKKVKKENILIEAIPNNRDMTEFVPRINAGYISFTTEEIKMTFFEWLRFMNDGISLSSVKSKTCPPDSPLDDGEYIEKFRL